MAKAKPPVVPTANQHVQTESTGEIGPPVRVNAREEGLVAGGKKVGNSGPIMPLLQLFARIGGEDHLVIIYDLAFLASFTPVPLLSLPMNPHLAANLKFPTNFVAVSVPV